MAFRNETHEFRNLKRSILMIFLTGCMLTMLAGESFAAFDKSKRRPGRPGSSGPQMKTSSPKGNSQTQRKDLLKGIGSKSAKAKNSSKKP